MSIEREQLTANDDDPILCQRRSLLGPSAQELMRGNFRKGAAPVAGRQQPEMRSGGVVPAQPAALASTVEKLSR